MPTLLLYSADKTVNHNINTMLIKLASLVVLFQAIYLLIYTWTILLIAVEINVCLLGMRTTLQATVLKHVHPLYSQIIVLGSVLISVLLLLITMATIKFAISPALSKFLLIFLYLRRM